MSNNEKEKLISIGNEIASVCGGSCYNVEIDRDTEEIIFSCIENGDCFFPKVSFEEMWEKYNYEVKGENVKTGWWSVEFDVTLDGETIRFDDLSETSQEHIIRQIAEGYRQGEIVEED